MRDVEVEIKPPDDPLCPLTTNPPAVRSTPKPLDDSIVPRLNKLQAYPAVPTTPYPFVTEINPLDATVNGFCVAKWLNTTVL